MANKVTIDIEAKFVDNASAGIDALNAKVEALNGKKVIISSGDVGKVVTVGDKMLKSAEATTKQVQSTIQYYQKGQSMAERTVSTATKAAERTQRMLNATAPKSAEIKSYANSSNTPLALPAAISPASAYGERIVNDIQDGFTRSVNRNQSNLSDVINRSIDNIYKKYEPSEYVPEPASYINPNTPSTASDLLRAGKSMINDGTGWYSKDAYEYVHSGIHGAEFNKMINEAERLEEATKIQADSVDNVTKSLSNAADKTGSVNYAAGARAALMATGNAKYSRLAGNLSKIFPSIDMNTLPGTIQTFGSAIGLVSSIKNVTGSITDVVEAYKSNTNAIDKQNAIYESTVSATGTAIGGVLGGIIGSVIAPGAGTLVGAGIGSTAGRYVGSLIGENTGRYDKSWDEYLAEAENKYFGNVTLSNDQIAYMVKGMTGNNEIRENNGFDTSLTNLLSYRTSLQNSANNLKILGSRIEIFDNMRLRNSKSDLNSFSSGIKNFGETAVDYLSTQMFNELSAADDLLGSGSILVEPISEKYTEAIKKIKNIQDKAAKYIDKAMKDNELSTPEMVKITGFKDQIQEIINGYTIDPSGDQIEAMKFLAYQGSLSKDSFDGILSNFGSELGNLQMQYATEMMTNIRNGQNRSEAMRDYYNKYNPELDNRAGLAVELAQNSMYDNLSYDRRTTSDAFEVAKGELEIQFDPSNGYGVRAGEDTLKKYLSPTENFKNLREVLGIDGSAYGKGIRGDVQGAYSMYYNSLDNSGLIKSLEASAKNGYATQTQMNALMGMYEMGAYGGNEHAMQSYFGMKMAQSEQTREWMNALIQHQPDRVPNSVIDAYNWAMGRAPNLNILEQPPTASEQTTPVSGQTTPVSEQTNQVTNEANNAASSFEEPFEKWPQTAAEKAKQAADECKKTTDTLAMDVLNSINDSFANVSTAELGELPIGNTIMDAIGNSVTNIDVDALNSLNLGQRIMDTLNSSFSNIDASAMGTLPIGQTIMQAVSDSISNMDETFASDLNIGETVMNSLNSSLASVNAEGIDLSGIGANISSKLINSLSSSIDVSGAGEIIKSQISSSLSDASIEPTINITPIYQIADGGAGLKEQLMSSMSAASVETTITANVTYGIESSAVDNYMPQDKAATAVYGLDSSAVDGWQPPNKTATVTYTIATLGSLPHFASGTDYMPYNSMATINDQVSAANPQELVVHDGRGYLFGGRNVQVPLSQGDRVFTASQTQRMIHGNFADGYDNGDYTQDYFNQYLNDDSTPQLDYGSETTISAGGSSVTIGNVEFKVENKGDGRDVVETLKDNCDEVAEVLASVIEKRLGDEFRNTPTKI